MISNQFQFLIPSRIFLLNKMQLTTMRCESLPVIIELTLFGPGGGGGGRFDPQQIKTVVT